MRALLIMVVLVLAGCSGPEGQVQDIVRGALKDPESARFEHVAVTEVDGVRVACGMVNAKNSLGGYVGNRAFMLKGDHLWLASDADQSTAITITCSLSTGGKMSDDEAASAALWAPRLPEPITIY